MLKLKKSFFIWKMYLNGFIVIKHKIAEFGAIWRKIKINYYISRLCWDKKNLFFIWKMYLKMALLRWKKNWGIWSNLTCRPRSSAGIFSALSSFVAETPTMLFIYEDILVPRYFGPEYLSLDKIATWKMWVQLFFYKSL